jgi:hypothetical protein
MTVQYLRAAHLVHTSFTATVLKRGGRAVYLAADAAQARGGGSVATLQCLYA